MNQVEQMKKTRLLETDEQTLDDLRIFSKGDIPGIFDLYNHAHTHGGEELLRELFRHPLSDTDAIQQRASLLAHLADSELVFPFEGALFDTTEKYMYNRPNAGHAPGQELNEKDIQNGVNAIIRLLHQVRGFMATSTMQQLSGFHQEREGVQKVLDDDAFKPVFSTLENGKIAYAAVAAFDHLFRSKKHQAIEQVLDYMYFLDAYLSVAKAARARGFTFPRVHPTGSQVLRIKGLYHPELNAPVANDFSLDGEKSLVFLTGANMAGKSTFLRSIGTAVYLAHMGFPVAASEMEFAISNGIYTTINLPDNLGMGASHFYVEVLRVKKIATELHQGKNLFVIFDELFRGTNVKDAHEATVAVAEAFAHRSSSRFIISSHIVEAADELALSPHSRFFFLPTRMNGHVPEYPYTLEEGVTDDRHGMIIIRNEGILEVLKNGIK